MFTITVHIFINLNLLSGSATFLGTSATLALLHEGRLDAVTFLVDFEDGGTVAIVFMQGR